MSVDENTKVQDGFMAMLVHARVTGSCIVDGTDYAGLAHDRLTEAAERIDALERAIRSVLSRTSMSNLLRDELTEVLTRRVA